MTVGEPERPSSRNVVDGVEATNRCLSVSAASSPVNRLYLQANIEKGEELPATVPLSISAQTVRNLDADPSHR
jgi:hypothetical protein